MDLDCSARKRSRQEGDEALCDEVLSIFIEADVPYLVKMEGVTHDFARDFLEHVKADRLAEGNYDLDLMGENGNLCVRNFVMNRRRREQAEEFVGGDDDDDEDDDEARELGRLIRRVQFKLRDVFAEIPRLKKIDTRCAKVVLFLTL